jgi:hypothetical protein
MNNQNNSRRGFLKKAALGSLMAVGIPEIISTATVSARYRFQFQHGSNCIAFHMACCQHDFPYNCNC